MLFMSVVYVNKFLRKIELKIKSWGKQNHDFDGHYYTGQHTQLRSVIICWSKVLLPTCHCLLATRTFTLERKHLSSSAQYHLDGLQTVLLNATMTIYNKSIYRHHWLVYFTY